VTSAANKAVDQQDGRQVVAAGRSRATHCWSLEFSHCAGSAQRSSGRLAVHPATGCAADRRSRSCRRSSRERRSSRAYAPSRRVTA